MNCNFDVYRFESIDSTNSEARRRMNKGISLPALFIAESQTEGRGRRGRTFYSQGGVYMTAAFKISEGDLVFITTKAAVAVSEAIESLIDVKVDIKWVNDIYLNGLKICGILCESVRDPETSEIKGVIIGVGINLNVIDFPKELTNIAGNLSAEGITAENLAFAVMEKLYEILESHRDFTHEYKKRSLVLGRGIVYEKNGMKISAMAEDIDRRGGLVVRNQDGSLDTLTSGEITLRITK